jgi:hypothetical protein
LLSINPAPLTIAAVNDARFVTEPDDFGSVIYDGFVNGETSSTPGVMSIGIVQRDLTIGTDLSNDADAIGVHVGALQPSGFDAHNYVITYQNGDYTIAGENSLLIKVARTEIPMTYGSSPDFGNITVRYLSEGTINSIPVIVNGNSVATDVNDPNYNPTYDVSFDIATISPALSKSGNLLTGGYQIAAQNISYNNIDSVNPFAGGTFSVGSFEVNPKILSLSIDNLVKDQDGNVIITKVYDGSANIDPSIINSLIYSNHPLIEFGDFATLIASGSYSDKNVQDYKDFNLSVSLSGSDRNNYYLPDSNISNTMGFVGHIKQLDQVTYTGGLGGNWSNPNNWTVSVNGTLTSIVCAIPDYSNVKQVIIPTNNGVNFDQEAVNGPMTSQIVNNGNLYLFADANKDFSNTGTGGSQGSMVIRNIISGTGQVSIGGTGSVVMINDNTPGTLVNTYSGGTNIAPKATLYAYSNNAIGSGPINSSYGNFGTYTDVVLPNLTVDGSITLVSDIKTTNDQIYNGAVFIPTSNINNEIHSTSIESALGNIQFMSTLNSDASKYTSLQQPSVVYIKATEGSVTFNDSVGQPLAGASGTAIYSNNNMDNLDVIAKNIYMNADAVTLNSQTYTAENVWIGDNGTNGLIRTMLSVDPSVKVNGNINDASPKNIHSLKMLALSQSPSIIPEIRYGNVGDINPLKDFKAVLSVQKDVFNSNLGNYDLAVSLGSPESNGIIYQYKPNNVNTSFNRFADAGTLLNNISQYMRSREMQQFSEGGSSEGTVEVSVICKQNPDGSDANKDCK